MLISNTNTPNFKAKYVGKTNIKKLNPLNGNYEKAEAFLLEFDSKNKNDLLVLKNTFEQWKSLFGRNIYEIAEKVVADMFDEVKNKVYFFTKQKDNFEKLEVNDILGLADVEPKSNEEGNEILKLRRLQVNTALINKQVPDFKYVGTGVLNILKEKFNKIIELNSVPSAVDFYKKNGFVDLQDSFFRFRWTPEN